LPSCKTLAYRGESGKTHAASGSPYEAPTCARRLAPMSPSITCTRWCPRTGRTRCSFSRPGRCC